jgi:hypothetical protein
MVSEQIRERREEYTLLMKELGAQPRETIIEQVRETQNRLMALLGPLGEEHTRWKPAPDEWCLRELTLHARFTEQLVAKLVHCLSRGVPPTAEDLEGAGIGMMPADDAIDYAGVLDGLRAANEAVIDAVRSAPAEPNTEFRLPHPFFGALNCFEWAAFQRVHDLDHIQHAERICGALPASA